MFRQIMGRDLLRPDPERHGALRMTDAARPILRGEETIMLRRDTLAVKERPAAKALVSEDAAPLLSALKAKRRALAEAQAVPAYVIFTDRTLIEMAETRPHTLDEFARIGGVGAAKLERYGAAFLAVISGEAAAPAHPVRRKLAGRPAGEVYDRLLAAQARLARGTDGTGKPMSCSAALLARIAALGPDGRPQIERILGDRLAERFGDAFAEVLAEE
jgi:ATP-dependent DNA helicase RecQ